MKRTSVFSSNSFKIQNLSLQKEKTEQMKNNDFSWIQTTKATRQTTSSEPGETGESRVTAKICLPWEEASGTINQQEHLNDNFGELLEAKCGLA